MSRPLSLTVSLLLALALAACGGPSGNGSTTPIEERAVDDDSFTDVRRLYMVLADDDPRREPVRRRLIEHLARRNETVLAAGDYDAVVAHLAEITALLAPSDLREGASLPDAIAPLARFVVEHGSPRGDEPRVLAGLLLLTRIEPGVAAHREEYERASSWGRDARLGLAADGNLESLMEAAAGLSEVWEEHARLCPSPEVLARLADLYVDMRDRITGTALADQFAPRGMSGMSDIQIAPALIERIPLDVAAVYLRYGDLATAASRVGAMGDSGGIEWRLRRLLEDAQREDGEGAEALGAISTGFERGRPDVAIAMCRIGVRRFPTDARFPLCLARLTAQLGDPGEATAWYAEAVRLAPDDRSVYDEALTTLQQILDDGIGDDAASIGRVRTIGVHAGHILDERVARWPGEPPEITPAMLHLALARAEMTAGNPREARQQLEESLGHEPTRDALAELGLLLVRTGQSSDAIATYRDALDRMSQQGREGSIERARLLELLGDAQRLAGDRDAATASYRQARDLLAPLLAGATEEPRALAPLRVRVGILARRLGDREASDRELRAAMDAAPSAQGVYAEILAHLVTADPAPELAEEVLRRALTGTTLDRAWKVYFALWTQIVARRGEAAPGEDVARILAEQAEGSGWPARLASLGAGTQPFAEVSGAASDAGQRCEAAFYEGARRLSAGDTSGAREALRAAIDTGMVGFFEYAMAQELLAQLGS